MKTAELTGVALDWAVATSQGWVRYPSDSVENGTIWHIDKDKAPFGKTIACVDYSPSTNWALAGPIIAQEKILLRGINNPEHVLHNQWLAKYDGSNTGQTVVWNKFEFGNKGKPTLFYGSTPLIAAMRCFVFAKLGNEIEIPNELL